MKENYVLIVLATLSGISDYMVAHKPERVQVLDPVYV